MTPEELFKGLRRFENDPQLKKKILFLVEEWRPMFPEIDIKEQVQLAHYWLISHGVYRKRNDLYLSNWMKKAEEIRKTKPVWGAPCPAKKYVEIKPPEDEVVTPEMFKDLRSNLKRA